MVKIVMKRSALGVSSLNRLVTVLLNVFGLFAAVSSADTYSALRCCAVEGVGDCSSHTLVMWQLVVNVLATAVILLLVLAFFDTPREMTRAAALRQRRWAWLHGFVALAFSTAALLVTSLLLRRYRPTSLPVVIWSNTAGVLGAICVCFANLPQIYTTWCLKAVGSVSIVTAFINVPGGIAVLAFQITQTPSDYGVWVPQLIAVLLATVLLVELIYYAIQERRAARANPVATTTVITTAPPTESAPLWQ
mmetsp:Transcript_40091/g.98387  ORF Transcript_40091/g.98387 Transcript_40091/m.98387 type:complete len:249 (+) Transcript_40091:66-812(+)